MIAVIHKTERKTDIDTRTLKSTWWMLKDYRDMIIHGEQQDDWTDKVKQAREVQRIMDLIEERL